VDLKRLAQLTAYASGADLANICRESALIALRENIHITSVVSDVMLVQAAVACLFTS
jgi:ATP-dependent Zn protease